MLVMGTVFVRAESGAPLPKYPSNEIFFGPMDCDSASGHLITHKRSTFLNSHPTLPERSLGDIQKPFQEFVILYKQQATLLSILCGRGLLGSMALRVKGPALPKPLSTLAPCNLGISSLATSLRAGD